MSDDLIGHNSEASTQLKSIVERIERLEEEKKAIADDIKEVYTEAKHNGYDTKALRKIVAERKQDPDALQELESMLGLYRHALGMVIADDDG